MSIRLARHDILGLISTENIRFGFINSFSGKQYAEHSGYWEKTNFLSEIDTAGGEMTFYDTVSGKPLFVAPRGRSWDDFLNESRAHGWPSFRDEEVIENDVRVLDNGEAVSLCGTHLGHNLPDRTGNRYCINLVSVAGVGK